VITSLGQLFPNHLAEDSLMRWKVLILASLASAVAGFGLAVVVALFFFNSLRELATNGLATMGIVTILFFAIAFAGFFVYRHTARRRKLQTTLAVVLTFLLTVTAFVLGTIITPRLQLPRPQIRG
jgi:Na+/proline symporter